LISLTHSAAAELAADRIRVNSVAPGNVATSMHFTALREEAEKRGITFEEMKKIEWDKIPLGRAADPAEIACAVAFLASVDGNYLTGATIDVNGGVLFS
jgi:NAD(P)-dependent dehydrogenase (short-subunit alcohol dehydrogenase family)